MLKFQMIFLPITIANSNRVGKGREEPNQNPVLKTPSEGRDIGLGFSFSLNFNLFGWVIDYAKLALILLLVVGVLYVAFEITLALIAAGWIKINHLY